MLHFTQEQLKWLTYSLELMLLFHSHVSLALYPVFTVLHHTLSQCLAKQVIRTMRIVNGMKTEVIIVPSWYTHYVLYDSIFLINHDAETMVYNEHL